MKNTKILNGVHKASRGVYIGTHTGKRFYPQDIRKSDICLEDIAHSISKQCRFAGHVSKFYSVAEHCVRVSWLLRDRQHHKDLQLKGLMHDASEAYLVDVPRPLKQLLDFAAYRNIEAKLQTIIYKKFNIDPFLEDQIIHEADNLLLATEAYCLMNNPYWCHEMPKLAIDIKPWGPEKAKRKFLARFKELEGK